MTAVRLFRLTYFAGIDRRYRGLTVGVFGGEKNTVFRGHVAAGVIQRIARDLLEQRLPRNLKRLEISDSELGLVIEHFFEMRDVPVGVDGIAMESAAEMIVHSAPGHFSKRENIHLQRVLAAIRLRIARVDPR